MSRDMQLGLLLAVGFLALVGGVLYYRIEHPEELEQYLNGGSQAQATAPVGPDTSHADNAPGTVADNTAPPSTQPPPFETTPPLNTKNPPVNTAGNSTSGSTGSNVLLAGGTGTGNTTPPAATMPAPAASAPILDFSALDKKSSETKPTSPAPVEEPKKTETGSNSRVSLPVEPPSSAPTLPLALPSSAPNLALDLNGKATPPAAETRKTEDKQTEEKKPIEIVVKPDNTAPPMMTPPSMSPPSGTNTTPLANTNKTPDTTIKMSAPDLNKSQELPQPPMVTPPTSGILFDDKPKNTTPGNTTPPLNTPPGSTNPGPEMNLPLANTSPLGSANTTTASTGQDRGAPADPDGFRSYPPKVTLGKPMPESEAALREKRWAESAGKPAPIIPSSTEWTGSSSSSTTHETPVNRKVVRDTYIPTERAQRGETFSSLSQRLYGDTNYAVALAAFNKEEGFVKMDQPEANEWVAKPNREILDQRFPNLIRRLTPSNISNMRNNAALTNGNTTGNTAAGTAASTNYPTYRVGKGEQLFEVAKKTLGDGYRWSEIYELNKNLLRESTELRAEMVLKLPVEARK